MAARTPEGEELARVSPPGFTRPFFSSCFIYGLARRAKRKRDYSYSRAEFEFCDFQSDSLQTSAYFQLRSTSVLWPR